MMHLFVVSVFASLFLLSAGQAVSMIPLSADGHAFHRGNRKSTTTVEFYIDLTCSSCMDSWPTITEVYSAYKEKVHFLYRVFPLPYHQQGFILAKAAQVVKVFGKQDAIFTFFDTVYAKQPAIYNSATQDMTYNQVVALVEDWALAGTGLTSEQYYIGMNTSNSVGSTCEMNARYMWKYVTLQGVFATPFYAIGGLQVGGLNTFDDWKAALDPLV